MKLYYCDSVQGNFGDDLNQWLWSRLLPGMWNDDDGVIFVGIGTILDNAVPPARVRAVFGSGAGYALVPDVAASDGNWHIYGVRGPLTARVLGLDRRLEMTDPAILLCALEEFKSPVRSGTLFVPHWKSVRYGSWGAICQDLGIEFVDPRTDSREVVRRIAGAEKVIAESMHAAIIADAFRVPWIPIVLSREISPFKWADWSLSKGLDYEPLCLPPSNTVEALRNRLLKGSTLESIFAYPAPEQLTELRALRFAGVEGLVRDFDVICARLRQPWRVFASRAGEIAFNRYAALVRRRGTAATRRSANRQFELAHRALMTTAAMPGTLSPAPAHERTLARTLEALERLKVHWAAGFAPERDPILDLTPASLVAPEPRMRPAS